MLSGLTATTVRPSGLIAIADAERGPAWRPEAGGIPALGTGVTVEEGSSVGVARRAGVAVGTANVAIDTVATRVVELGAGDSVGAGVASDPTVGAGVAAGAKQAVSVAPMDTTIVPRNPALIEDSSDQRGVAPGTIAPFVTIDPLARMGFDPTMPSA